MDDEKPPESGKERSLRNLLPPIRPGEARNKTGRNGRDKNKIVVDFLDALDPKDAESRPRIHVLLEAMYLRARIGNGMAMKVLAEQYAGKPPSSSPIEVALKFAEHLRTVARDHVEIGRQLIGKQAETWSPEQIRAFWDVCERDPSRFLRMAEDAIGVAEPVPVDVEPSQQAIAAPGEAEAPSATPAPTTLDEDGDE